MCVLSLWHHAVADVAGVLLLQASMRTYSSMAHEPALGKEEKQKCLLCRFLILLQLPVASCTSDARLETRVLSTTGVERKCAVQFSE